MADWTNPLLASHRAAGADLLDCGLPVAFGPIEQEYQACDRGAVADWARSGLVRITGKDRIDFLNRLTSNRVDAKTPASVHTFLLSVQARPVAEFWLCKLEEELLLEVPRELAAAATAELDRYHFTEKLAMEDLSCDWTVLCLLGRQAPAALAQASGQDLKALEPGGVDALEGGLVRFALPWPGREMELLFLPAEQAPRLWTRLSAELSPVGEQVLEVLRVEAGIPRFAKDYDQDTLLLEFADRDAFSDSKGCYPGQEVVARILHRGHVNRKLTGLASQASLPEAADLYVEGQKVGWITSAVHSPVHGHLALGYVRREHREPATRLELESGQVLSVRELLATK